LSFFSSDSQKELCLMAEKDLILDAGHKLVYEE
jgi:hypothetical protein